MAVAIPMLVEKILPGQPSCFWVGLILIAGAAACWGLQRSGRPSWAAGTLFASTIATYIALFGVVAVPFSRHQSSLRVNELVEHYGGRTTPVGAFRIFLPGLIYYAHRSEPIVGVKTPEDFSQLSDGKSPFLLVTDPQGYDEIRSQLPPDTVVLHREKRFYKPGDVLLIGPQSMADSDRQAHLPDTADTRTR